MTGEAHFCSLIFGSILGKEEILGSIWVLGVKQIPDLTKNAQSISRHRKSGDSRLKGTMRVEPTAFSTINRMTKDPWPDEPPWKISSAYQHGTLAESLASVWGAKLKRPNVKSPTNLSMSDLEIQLMKLRK